MKPKVSVIIPVYNRKRLVRRAAKSILSQSFTDFEIIVVDDGSTSPDGTSLMAFSPKVRYIQQNHLGAPAARNRGILEAKGEYIAFLDSDDYFLPGKLEKQVAAMENNPQAILSHTSYIRHTAGEGYEAIDSGSFSGMVYPWLLFNCIIAMPTVMIRADCLEGYSFREDIDCADDLILWAQLARLGPFIGIREPLSFIQTNASTNAFNLQRQLVSISNIVKYGIKQDGNLSLITRLSLLLYWGISKYIIKHDNKLAKLMEFILSLYWEAVKAKKKGY